ncbi:MAG TPA: GGDEF domain-containing protein [Devosia sp.]|nr:GGDEF domain-containing protein [Devosia sp.]
MSLLERAKIPPQPPFYRLLFDYVAGVQGLFATRVRDILDEGGQAGEKLYKEFVAPYQPKEAIEVTIDRMVGRLKTLESLVMESSAAARQQSATLGAATERLTTAGVNPALLKDFVTRLQATNLRLFQANSKLLSELDAAHAELDATRDEMAAQRESAKRDPLTGLANRAGLDFAFVRLLQLPESRPLSCAVIDIDHFKTLNDGYGHQVGDEVLRVVSRSLLAAARSSDVIGRAGGDEFVVILPGAGLAAAADVADGLRAAIANASLKGALGPDVLGGVTASIGVAEYRENESVSSLIERADRCLYRAKSDGRNRVESVEA